jgi:hypothetical protein
MKPDLVTKCLLGMIVILLGVLVFRPSFNVAPYAFANSDKDVTLGYKAAAPIQISNMGLKVKSIHVIDSASAFVAEYEDGFKVYRVYPIKTSRASLAAARGRR